jgi:mRNA interferase MazF
MGAETSISCRQKRRKYVDHDLADQCPKVRPAVVVSAPHISQDILIVPLTSKTSGLLEGEFILPNCSVAGLNVVTAVKRGIYTVNKSLVIKQVGHLTNSDSEILSQSLKIWLGI